MNFLPFIFRYFSTKDAPETGSFFAIAGMKSCQVFFLIKHYLTYPHL